MIKHVHKSIFINYLKLVTLQSRNTVLRLTDVGEEPEIVSGESLAKKISIRDRNDYII
jgi:hypothetical protein